MLPTRLQQLFPRVLRLFFLADARIVQAVGVENMAFPGTARRKKRKTCLTGGGKNNFQLSCVASLLS
ncbi:hypothetical protein [Pantoea sp. C2G6]|uniref:hypothetical protein n=1 Tax=Pantoea sp. C2G6 TaxID=3243084 RepID=UPI003ED9DF13